MTTALHPSKWWLRCVDNSHAHLKKDRYIDFLSHHPSFHKRSVLNTLLLRPRNIPSATERKTRGNAKSKSSASREQLPRLLYQWMATTPTRPVTNGFVVLPYVLCISERFGRYKGNKVYKSRTSRGEPPTVFFPRPKQQDETNYSSSGVVYIINCSQYDFVKFCHTERSLKTRVSEHTKAVVLFDHNFKLTCHAHKCHHHMDFESVKVVGHEAH